MKDAVSASSVAAAPLLLTSMHSNSCQRLKGVKSETSMSPDEIYTRSSHHALNTVQLEELQKLRSQSPVIKLSASELDRFTAGGSRPYALMVFWNAPKIKEAKNIKLKEQLDKFKHVAKVAKNAATKDPAHAANTLFFVEVDMEESREMFMRFGVTNLPWVTHVGKDMGRQYASNPSSAHHCLSLMQQGPCCPRHTSAVNWQQQRS